MQSAKKVINILPPTRPPSTFLISTPFSTPFSFAGLLEDFNELSNFNHRLFHSVFSLKHYAL